MKRIIAVLLIMLPVFAVAQSTTDIQKMLRYRKYTTAEDLARKLVNTNAANAENWYWLSQVLIQTKDSVELINLQSKFPAGINNDAWLSIVQGNIALASGKAQEARNHYEVAVDETRRRDPAVLAAIARSNIYSNNGDKQYAISLLERAIKRDRKNPELYTLVGDAYFRLKNGSEAYQAFEKATKLNAAYAPALYELGKIFATQDNEPLYLKYFNQTIAADPAFAPALYDLYYHYYDKDLNKSYDYFTKYMSVADVQPSDEYQLIDLLYLKKEYTDAVSQAKTLLLKETAENRLNKLLAYTYKDLGKNDSAVHYMNVYFTNGADSEYVVKDYELMAAIYDLMEGKEDSVIAYYVKMVPFLENESDKKEYFKKIADLYKEQKDYFNQALWLGNHYNNNANTTNLDLFNWGLALYQSQQYNKADSIFGTYVTKYPEQVFGYYWQARTNAAIDSTMEQGLAVPHYTRMIEIAEQDTTSETNKRYLVEAYGYIAAYTANEEKNYTTAVDYFEKLLVLDPANNDAKRYIEILEQTIENTASQQ